MDILDLLEIASSFLVNSLNRPVGQGVKPFSFEHLVSVLMLLQRFPTDRAYFIAKELLTTERTYVKDLEVVTVVRWGKQCCSAVLTSAASFLSEAKHYLFWLAPSLQHTHQITETGRYTQIL